MISDLVSLICLYCPKSFWIYRRTWQKLQLSLNLEAEIQIINGDLTLILAFCYIRLFEKINPLSTIGPTIVISKGLEMFFDDIPQRFSGVSRIVIVEKIQLCGWNVQDLTNNRKNIFVTCSFMFLHLNYLFYLIKTNLSSIWFQKLFWSFTVRINFKFSSSALNF